MTPYRNMGRITENTKKVTKYHTNNLKNISKGSLKPNKKAIASSIKSSQKLDRYPSTSSTQVTTSLTPKEKATISKCSD